LSCGCPATAWRPQHGLTLPARSATGVNSLNLQPSGLRCCLGLPLALPKPVAKTGPNFRMLEGTMERIACNRFRNDWVSNKTFNNDWFNKETLNHQIWKRIAVALLAIVTVLICSGSVAAQQTETGPPQVGEGSLLYHSGISGRYESIPLLHTDATIDVRGL